MVVRERPTQAGAHKPDPKSLPEKIENVLLWRFVSLHERIVLPCRGEYNNRLWLMGLGGPLGLFFSPQEDWFPRFLRSRDLGGNF